MENGSVYTGAVYEQKLSGFDGMKRTGVVVLRPLKSRKGVNGRELLSTTLSFRCFKNPQTGLWHGVPIGKNPDGTYKFKRITIQGHRFYNLEQEADAQEWHVVQYHSRIKGSPFENHDPLFVVEDKEKEAEIVIERIVNSTRAIDVIYKLSGNKLAEFGRLFGISPEVNSPLVIKQLLLEKAEEKPLEILEKWDNVDDREIMIIIKRAIATGLIKQTLDKGYLYKDGIPLGVTEGGVVNYLRKDITMLAVIDQESKEEDKFFHTDSPDAEKSNGTSTNSGLPAGKPKKEKKKINIEKFVE